ncbi:dynein axonemal intermediate chain 4-like [Adelges cooleyi]|uniref:dynein axonemal intermediate chain 4-like n=1 Tax=Adelges cooleyi TaxID=133065 RepID=UPI00217FE088|nr:dynein axonemal intermediate chain 4-like [Adelges cooleyi]
MNCENSKSSSSRQIVHYDDHKIDMICASLEKEIAALKNAKYQDNPLMVVRDHTYFKATLQETNTLSLLELPALASTKKHSSDPPWSQKKDFLKYSLPGATQTSTSFQRTQHTQTAPISLTDKSNFASVWNIQINTRSTNPPLEKPNIHSDVLSKKMFVFERIVTSNYFSEKQIEFKTLHSITDSTSYRYVLEDILQFSTKETENCSVTSFVWNTLNEDILAVSYGKWNDDARDGNDDVKGIVYCWSLKNPVNPERKYKFDKPITCLNFSKTDANILVAGSYDGYIFALDITQERYRPLTINEKYLKNFPICSIVSLMQKGYNKSEKEFVLSVDSNGTVRKWSITFESNKIDQVSLLYCGIRNGGSAIASNAVVAQNMSGTILSLHPTDRTIYFVGTKFGFIVKNTIDNCDDYDDIFIAHHGPVYGIKFSPFFPNIFMTYGADWQINIWTEDIEKPLLSLCYFNAIEDADWSPINSTVIVSVSQAVICIWDFARKTVEPVMTFTCEVGVHFTLVKFSKRGNNILTGDLNGQIRCFHIKSMPAPPFLQRNSILTALKNVMSNPEMARICKKI